MTPSATQVRVLYWLARYGANSWLEVNDAVRRQSGRTVRPSAATLWAMRRAGWLELNGNWVSITDAGRAALGGWTP